jgi:hypothetical protein
VFRNEILHEALSSSLPSQPFCTCLPLEAFTRHPAESKSGSKDCACISTSCKTRFRQKRYFIWQIHRSQSPSAGTERVSTIHLTSSQCISLRSILIISLYVRFITLMMEAVRTSETSICSSETTRRCIPEGSHLPLSVYQAISFREVL